MSALDGLSHHTDINRPPTSVTVRSPDLLGDSPVPLGETVQSFILLRTRAEQIYTSSEGLL